MHGTVFSIQRFSIHDGPGIRTTVFLKGCPLICPWCHNPESRSAGVQVWTIEARCISCGACDEACEGGKCTTCGSCVDVCPTGSRQRIGRILSVDQLLGEIERDRPFFNESGGGVTFSGGEPFMQYRFLRGCLEACRNAGLDTAVDTCGYTPLVDILDSADLVDLYLYDLKIIDENHHIAHTGVSIEPILKNLAALDKAGARIWIRVPLIPGINDDDINLEAIGRVASGLKNTTRLHILPYHGAGIDKLRRLGERTARAAPRAVPRTSEAVRLFERQGLDVVVGG